jgi:hypothetical protein
MLDDPVKLRLDGRVVAEYVVAPEVDPTLAPRPYLHPVRTLDGAVVTDAEPEDHRWHLGASLAVQDVSGTNLWGGRTYMRGTGYTWRDDHGRIAHVEFLARADDGFTEHLQWCDPAGGTLLTEQRRLRARLLPGRSDAWVLDLAYDLTAPPDRDITLGSPATNGRPGGAGYGGFFWRAAPTTTPPRVFTATASGERAVNGSTGPWVALTTAPPDPYTLIFTGLAPGDHWFVRARMYPGVCAALAFEKPRVIEAGQTLSGSHAVVVADAVLSPRIAGRIATTLPDCPRDRVDLRDVHG